MRSQRRQDTAAAVERQVAPELAVWLNERLRYQGRHEGTKAKTEMHHLHERRALTSPEVEEPNVAAGVEQTHGDARNRSACHEEGQSSTERHD